MTTSIINSNSFSFLGFSCTRRTALLEVRDELGDLVSLVYCCSNFNLISNITKLATLTFNNSNQEFILNIL